MHIPDRLVIVCNIQIVIWMLYHSFETLSLLSFFYLMEKPGKSFVQIGSHFQIALFIFILSKFPAYPSSAYSNPATADFILLNVPTYPLIKSTTTPPFIWDLKVLEKQFVQSLALAASHVVINFVKNELLRK